jgi:Uma2 family endonuclease
VTTASTTALRKLEPGTSGWTASDLDDSRIAEQWDRGRFEIINGILKKMPPADFDHGAVVFELLTVARQHLRVIGTPSRVSVEVDLIVDEDDVLRVDGMLITEPEVTAQKRVLIELNRDQGKLGRIRVAPKLVIESVSLGHERHDRLTKRRIYAGFGIPNYWIVDAVRRSLECLVLDGQTYRTDATGKGDDHVQIPSFGGLTIALRDVWGADIT